MIWLRAFLERRGGSGTRSGFRASFGDFGMKGPPPLALRSLPVSLLLFVSVTGTPSDTLTRPFLAKQCGENRVQKTAAGAIRPADPSSPQPS